MNVYCSEKIVIGETDTCTVCNKYYKHSYPRRHTLELPEGLYEVKIRTEHPSCLSKIRRIEKLKRELLDLEFSIYLVKTI